MPNRPPAVPASQLSSRELGAWKGMLRVHRELIRELDAQLERAHGLPLTSYEVLMYVADADGARMRMRDLADCILLSRSGLSRLVDRLERDGLVERQDCHQDARGCFAALTPAGRATLDAARATHLQGVRTLFLDRFSEEEVDLLSGLWGRFAL